MFTDTSDFLKFTKTMYAYRNVEERSFNNCCSDKTVKNYIF